MARGRLRRPRRQRRLLVVEEEHALRPSQRGEAVVDVRVLAEVARLETVAHAVVDAEGLSAIAEPGVGRDAVEHLDLALDLRTRAPAPVVTEDDRPVLAVVFPPRIALDQPPLAREPAR